MKQKITLYGAPHSLYTGRVRSYLIKAGIAYREMAPNTTHYLSKVLPKAGGRFGMPTIEIENGDVIRDGAAIVDYFEKLTGNPFTPSTPKQSFFSLLLDVIGAEGLLRPAMHYRWHFEEENFEFLKLHFRMITSSDAEGEKMADRLFDDMRIRATPAMGATSELTNEVESVYLSQLQALDRHFVDHGYLLGGRPSLGDFGLLNPLFAHLGRDPKALSLMQAEAMHVFRWVERMNRASPDLFEYVDQSETWLPDDVIPATLIEFLRAMAEDFVPETVAAAIAINNWLEEQENLEIGTHCTRSVGTATFELRGKTFSSMAQPYRFYLLNRVQKSYEKLDKSTQEEVDALLDACGMTAIIGTTLSRQIGLVENMEVWL